MRGSLKTVAIRIPEKGKEKRGRKEVEEKMVKEWRRIEDNEYVTQNNTKRSLFADGSG
jgi:hypothetical protein